VFKKLFGRKQAPTIDGKLASSSKVDGVTWVKKFILELSNMEGSPTYNLTHQLTVGSEVGNIVIADPSVSPRHCTFILQEEVVSVLDHGSVAGTFINGQKIPPGRYIILEETDNIRVGDLEVQVHVKTDSVKEEIEEAVPEQAEEEEPEKAEEEDMEEKPVPETNAKESKPSFFKKWFKSKSKDKKEDDSSGLYRKEHKREFKKEDRKPKSVALSGNSPYATNSLVRVFAVLCDILVAYALYIVLIPFDEFRQFSNDVPAMLGSLLDVDWNALWAALNEDYAFLGELLKDIYTLSAVTFHLGPLIFLFILVRLITTLLFGVTISEAFLGVRSHGNAAWKRIGGVLRVLIGIVTGPLIIFDIPAIVSRRTFKEFMTFTHTYVISKFLTILGIILYLPLLVAIALLAPLIQGLELPEPIAVSDVLERRIKVVQPTDTSVEIVKTKDYSEFFNLELAFDGQNVSLVPFFKFTEIKKKINYNPAIIIYHKDLQRSVRMEVFKTFDLKELLAIGIRGDFFLEGKFPLLNEFVHSEGFKKSVFKTKNDENENTKFANEVVSFTKVAFELSAENAFDQMQAYTPYLKGFLDYKASLLQLIEFKKFDQVDFIKLGNAYFLRISYKTMKPFDLLVPLIRREGRILKVEFDKKENLGVLRNKFYKFTLEEANWFPTHDIQAEDEALLPLQVVDFFSKLDIKGDKVSSDKAQALYGYYYENSANVLKRDDSVEYEIWKKSVDAIFAIMQNMKESIPAAAVVESVEPVVEPVPEVVEEEKKADKKSKNNAKIEEIKPVEVTPPPVEVPVDPRMKLFQNFQDLKDAVENKNKEYFGVEDSVKI
jgi:pSer/pThr/pTyr-binding forkhead associated (FHA) protein